MAVRVPRPWWTEPGTVRYAIGPSRTPLDAAGLADLATGWAAGLPAADWRGPRAAKCRHCGDAVGPMPDHGGVAESEPDAGWVEQRRRALAAHAAALRRQEAIESERAAAMLVEFVRTARERGLPTVPLIATSHNGRHRYRTGLRGWYLRPDGGIAVAEDGRFYVLSVQPSLRALVTGVRVTPSTPRLVLGEGGRDGERVTLRAQLDSLLGGRSG